MSTSKECGRLTGCGPVPSQEDGGILRITRVSQADLGTYCCVAHNVANTRHSQDARLMLKGKRGPGGSEQALGGGGCGSWRHREWVWLMWLHVVQILGALATYKDCAGCGNTDVSRWKRPSQSIMASQSWQLSRQGSAVGTQGRGL